MSTLATAIEEVDKAVIRSLFSEHDFRLPLIKWDPGVDDIDAPELRFLLSHWQSLLKGQEIPHLRQVDPLNLIPCLGYLMILDIGEDELTYRMYGSKIARASGFDLTGKTVSSITSHSLIPAFFNACYRAARRKRLPLLTQHQTPPEISVYSWTRLTLPLVDDEGTIMRFLVGNIPGPFKSHLKVRGTSL
jgi:hypothetical protein